MRSFEATVEDGFGDVTLVELKEGGAEIPVTSENKKEYVDLCVDVSINPFPPFPFLLSQCFLFLFSPCFSLG